MSFEINIDGAAVRAEAGWTILRAAAEAGIYIPSLCAHPDLPPQNGTAPATAVYHGARRVEHDPQAEGPAGCGLCVVSLQGEGEVSACATEVQPGMVVRSTDEALVAKRRHRLSSILADHPHACLTCAQRDGCTREPCSMNVPAEERCCELLGPCALQAVAEHVGIDPATPRYVPAAERNLTDTPLFVRSPALCIACGRCVRACNSREVLALGWVRSSAGARFVGPVSQTPVLAGCRLCGSCVEVCPTGALVDRDIKPSERYTALVPCRSACPAGTDAPRYVRLAAQGRFEEAAAVVAERAPLVTVLGQVCFHPCESACRRNDVNQAPVSICRIKRKAGEASATAWVDRLPPPRPATGHRVAVVGGGPAGLTAAHWLRLLGHRVTLFESRPRVGGMLEHGIPPFRLSREVVAEETAALVQGVEVRTGVRIGFDGVTVHGLRTEHDAVILATGAPLPVELDVAGEDLLGVQSGLGFLASVSEGSVSEDAFVGKRVVVIGGGNVAIDCARAAQRMGAARVRLVCLEQPGEMPAYADEVRAAKSEGVQMHHGWGVRALHGNGTLARVDLKRCTRVFDDEGRFAPTYDDDASDSVRADAAIVAVGQRVDRSLLPGGSQQDADGVFLAGDVKTGPRSVVEAIASGREAALAVDRHVGGTGKIELVLGPAATDAPKTLGRVDGFVELARIEPATHEMTTAPRGLYELEQGLQREQARREADRCLQCDLRLFYRTPPMPPAKEARLAMQEQSLAFIPEGEGVVRFYDTDGALLEIVGGSDMRQEVRDRIDAERACVFDCEPCPMYTQRQNELLSQYMEAHGSMPPGVRDDDDLDDLF